MNSRENASLVIKDKHFVKYGKIKTFKTKKGYKISYEREKSFLPNCSVNDEGDYIFFGFLLMILSAGISLAFVTVAPKFWFIVPLLILGLILYILIKKTDYTKQDFIVFLISLVVSIGVTWAVLSGAYNGNFYNHTDFGKKNYEWVKEHINPNFLYFKK